MRESGEMRSVEGGGGERKGGIQVILGRHANLIPQSACSASNHPFHPHSDFNVKHFTSARDRLIDSRAYFFPLRFFSVP